jgi:ribosomal protein S18 acetylase RimI-like enzyme
MTESEFAAWSGPTIQAYAEDIARAQDLPLHRALTIAHDQFPTLLPEGLASEGMWLYVIVDPSGADVGTLWLGRSADGSTTVGFVWDITIDETRRGQGLGRAAMLRAEVTLRDQGFRKVALNVFGFNHGARGLYASLGYTDVATLMAKPL